MKTIYTLFAFLTLLCNNAFAEQVLPPKTRGSITVPATMEKDHVRQIRIGQFVAKFEETTLGEINKIIGEGTICHHGDASESIYWLCYSLHKQRIWFISHGEMGGPNHVLTQVSAMSYNSTFVDSSSCPSLPTNSQPISFDFGWLGAEKQTIIKSLGQPSGTTENSLSFYYSGKQPGLYHGRIVDWNVIGYLEMNLDNDKVVSIRASHVTSY